MGAKVPVQGLFDHFGINAALLGLNDLVNERCESEFRLSHFAPAVDFDGIDLILCLLLGPF